MKTQKTLKALALSLAMTIVMLLPTTMNAQDGFFRDGGDYANRDMGISNENFSQNSGGINNQSFPAPLGSGLLIMVAAGGAYAVIRRKR